MPRGRHGKRVLCKACRHQIPVADTGRCWCGTVPVCMECQRAGEHAACIDAEPTVELKPLQPSQNMGTAGPIVKRTGRPRTKLAKISLEDFIRIADRYGRPKPTVINW